MKHAKYKTVIKRNGATSHWQCDKNGKQSWQLLSGWEFWTSVRDGGERMSLVKWIFGRIGGEWATVASASELYSWLRRGAAITQEAE